MHIIRTYLPNLLLVTFSGSGSVPKQEFRDKLQKVIGDKHEDAGPAVWASVHHGRGAAMFWCLFLVKISSGRSGFQVLEVQQEDVWTQRFFRLELVAFLPGRGLATPCSHQILNLAERRPCMPRRHPHCYPFANLRRKFSKQGILQQGRVLTISLRHKGLTPVLKKNRHTGLGPFLKGASTVCRICLFPFK